MSKQFNNIDKEIRRKFERFEESPPDNLWSNIKSSMQTTPKVAPSKPVRVGPLSMNAAIISVSVIIVATIIAVINPFNNIQTSEPVAQIIVDTTTHENIELSPKKRLIENNINKPKTIKTEEYILDDYWAIAGSTYYFSNSRRP